MCSHQEICSEKKCSHGVIPAGACCSPCIDCQYNSHVVLDKMQFSPPGDPCSRCICRKGNITCVRETCPKLLCVATELPHGSCCPVCKGCLNSNGQYIEHGRKWTHSNDICQICSCDEGVIKCDRVLCDVPCTHPVRKPDVCCAECRDCQVLGLVYPNNVEIPTSDDCKKCFCFNGNMECESVSCATVTCENPRVEPGSCCPSCKECNFQGTIYQDGETFHPKSDSCYFCICDKGAVSCKRKMDQCNPQCTDPVKLPGQCCPVCDGCEYEGKVLKNKERFSPNPLNLCLQCECINGNVKCSEQQCPKLSCPNPIKPENQCCEECLEYCRDRTNENIQHNEGDIWVSSENPCEICTCKDSVVRCERTDCPPVHCQHAAAPFGVCCPECEHCEFTHRLYRNGEEFTHRDDPCQICKCQNGSVSCETVFCDSQTCMEP
ncbi:Kielin/chordin-like protein, partial [Stegodyphus mimosarum]